MGAYVKMEQLDLTVLGQVQYSFTVDGVKGCDIGTACINSGYQRVIAIEQEVNAMTAATKVRAKKTEELGNVLGKCLEAIASIGDKRDDEELDLGSGFWGKSQSILNKYGITLTTTDSTSTFTLQDKMKVTNIRKAKEDVKFALDEENNSLQRNTSALQTVVNKRDSAMNTISKIQQKVDKTYTRTIQKIGG